MELLALVDMLPGTPLGQLLVALVGVSAVVLVGRFLLNMAWKLLIVATLVVAAVYTVGVLQ